MSIFDIIVQQKNISGKIVVGLERISEAFKVLLWDHAKTIGLSPIQIQLLIFIAYHKNELCKVSHLANEFNITKPTVSDAIRVLNIKDLVKKENTEIDNRSYTISLTAKGKKIVRQTENFADVIKDEVDKINSKDLEVFYNTLTHLIYNLNKKGVLNVQRTCYACKFYDKNKKKHYCNLLEKELYTKEIRIDCPEFEEKL